MRAGLFSRVLSRVPKRESVGERTEDSGFVPYLNRA